MKTVGHTKVKEQLPALKAGRTIGFDEGSHRELFVETRSAIQ
jgi:hypothetical protein